MNASDVPPAPAPAHHHLHTPFRVLFWIMIIDVLSSASLFYGGNGLALQVLHFTQNDLLATIVDLTISLLYTIANVATVALLLAWWELTRPGNGLRPLVPARTLRITRVFVLAFTLFELSKYAGEQLLRPTAELGDSALWAVMIAKYLVYAATFVASGGAAIGAASCLRSFLRADEPGPPAAIASAIIRAAAVIYPLYLIALVVKFVAMTAFIDQHDRLEDDLLGVLWQMLNVGALVLTLLFAYLYHECAKQTRPPRATA